MIDDELVRSRGELREMLDASDRLASSLTEAGIMATREMGLGMFWLALVTYYNCAPNASADGYCKMVRACWPLVKELNHKEEPK